MKLLHYTYRKLSLLLFLLMASPLDRSGLRDRLGLTR